MGVMRRNAELEKSAPLFAHIRIVSRPAGRGWGAQRAEWDKSVIVNPRLMETLGRGRKAPRVGNSSGAMQHRWDVGGGRGAGAIIYHIVEHAHDHQQFPGE